MKKLAIIASGDLGQLMAYHAEACGYKAIGFFDDYRNAGEKVNEIPVLGKTDAVEAAYARKEFDVLMLAIGYKHLIARKEIFARFKGKIPYANLLHPSSYIDKSCTLGEGIFILPGCTLDMHAHIGDNVLMNTGCILAHDVKVGSHSFLSPAVRSAGFVTIGESCVLGIGTTIIDNISICDQAQTGGGSVVVKNIMTPGLYVGVPARLVRTAE